MLKKISPVLFALFLCALCLVSCVVRNDYGYNDPYYRRPVYIAPGVGLGTIIAVVVSWTRNKSILWAIIHGLLGWLYVIYAIIFRKRS